MLSTGCAWLDWEKAKPKRRKLMSKNDNRHAYPQGGASADPERDKPPSILRVIRTTVPAASDFTTDE